MLVKFFLHHKLLTWLRLLIVIFIATSLRAGPLLLVEYPPPDTLRIDADTLHLNDRDTTNNKGSRKGGKSQTVLDGLVERHARDSIVQDLANRKAYLYGEAVVTYGNIKLEAAYIEMDFSTNTVFAKGVEDSTGKIIGVPVFTEDGTAFKAQTMTYDFTTQKGIIKDVTTEDGEGYLYGEKVKKLNDNTVNMLHGSYTTCNIEGHPHFAFRFKKSKVIPDDKIVTGPAYMEIEGIPTPLAIPYGFFPNKSGQTSGIIIPTYGESANRGFYLENGGYYWAINDYMDFQVTGDIYSRGSWAIKPRFRYKKRYKYSGSIELGYAQNIVGYKGEPDYSKSTDFRIKWIHRQDPKARPHSTFTSNVNIISGNYAKYNVTDLNTYLSNEFQSSVAYQTSWAGKYFLTLNGSMRQNTKTHQVNINLPELTFTVNQFYPLKKQGGKRRFYEDLSMSYSVNAKNTITTADSILFEPGTLQKYMQNGAIHRIPISLPVKILKYFNLSTSVNLTDRMYSQSIRQSWSEDTLIAGTDTIVGYVKTDTVQGFRNAFDFNLNSTLTTRVFGMLNFKKGPLRAIRHVLTPSIGFTYTPDFGTSNFGYYGTYINGDGIEIKYSKFHGNGYKSLYGTPPGERSGRINVSFGNNLEIKVRSRKDTITGMKKIKLLENLTFSGSYDLARDSLKMSLLTVTGRTTLWKNFSIQYASLWDPYVLDSAGYRTNTYEWTANRRLFRLDNTRWNLSLNYKIGDKDLHKKKEPKDASEEEMIEIEGNPDNYVDWDIPWSLNIRYSFAYTNKIDYINYIRLPEKKIVQTLGLSGQLNITPKWKFTFNTGWDFTNNALSYTSINIYRDLHCWEMRFSWVPIGPRQSWNFSINVKASILQDLKLNRKKDFRDI
jgi:lipopolysaccharide assembly outer membrane protein LptD (OstA)